MNNILLTREGFTLNQSKRIPEKDEVINGEEGKMYANRKDDRSLSFSMVAYDIVERLSITKDSHILEVCCGAGQLAHNLFKLTGNKNIVATDGSKILIDEAKKRYGSDNISFEVHNVHKHPHKEKFDFIICKDSFHHFKKSDVAIKELVSLLKEGGILYIWDLNRECSFEQVKYRCDKIAFEHEGRRFLQSLNASLTVREMKEAASHSGASDFQSFYPFKFSDKNIDGHKDLIEKDMVKEHELNKLFAIYLIKK